MFDDEHRVAQIAQVLEGCDEFIDVRELDADFLVFSGHKTLGPTGTGVLYGKKDLLGKLTPLNSGGGTVTSSTYESFSEEKLPERLEAGLQDYAGIIGLGAACNYIQQIGFSMIEKHEQRLVLVHLAGHQRSR
jgi:cysteine desulfurase/selenocysteine lyase